MTETTNLEYSSNNPGLMHACGHDGHTTMLLGAARYLSETRNFSGRVALIFQPAEENEGGGRLWWKREFWIGLTLKMYMPFIILQTLNWEILYNACPIMAGADKFHIDVVGVGGHGAYPHETKDPITAALELFKLYKQLFPEVVIQTIN